MKQEWKPREGECESVIGHTIHKLEKEQEVGYEVVSETGDKRREEKQQSRL